MHFGIVIPAWQRHTLLDLCLRNLAEMTTHHKLSLVVVGSEGHQTASIAHKWGATYIESPNKPLGRKWNLGLAAAPGEAVMLLGSDNFIDSRYLDLCALEMPYADSVGCLDAYILDSKEKQLAYWPGYTNHRAGQPVGPGRCLSRAALDSLSGAPYAPDLNRYLDSSQTRRTQHLARHSQFRLSGGMLLDVKDTHSLTPMSSLFEPVEMSILYDRLPHLADCLLQYS